MLTLLPGNGTSQGNIEITSQPPRARGNLLPASTSPPRAIHPANRVLDHLLTYAHSNSTKHAPQPAPKPTPCDIPNVPNGIGTDKIKTREGDVPKTPTHPLAAWRDLVLDGLGGRGGVGELVGRVLDEVDACCGVSMTCREKKWGGQSHNHRLCAS
jgi:hypothetical protein